jgi:uncharacterized protein (TIGR03086 family)
MRLTPPLLADAATSAASTVRGVQPDQLGASTPCQDWQVRQLVNHLLQVTTALRLAGNGEPVPNDVWGRDLMSGDGWAATLDSQARQAIEAWAEPKAWEGTVSFGGSEMPASMVATMLASDLVIHGWDLARATDQEYTCLDDTAEMAHGFVQGMGEQGRGMGIFADPVPVAEYASALDRAVGLSGRDPAWKP